MSGTRPGCSEIRKGRDSAVLKFKRNGIWPFWNSNGTWFGHSSIRTTRNPSVPIFGWNGMRSYWNSNESWFGHSEFQMIRDPPFLNSRGIRSRQNSNATCCQCWKNADQRSMHSNFSHFFLSIFRFVNQIESSARPRATPTVYVLPTLPAIQISIQMGFCSSEIQIRRDLPSEFRTLVHPVVSKFERHAFQPFLNSNGIRSFWSFQNMTGPHSVKLWPKFIL